jgi:hypothetical protein
LIDDYQPDWFLGAHPSVFPHNQGGAPAGLSLERWAKLLLQRYPREQFAQNLGLITDLFNVIQRHLVNTHAWVQFKLQPAKAAGIASLSEDHVRAVLEAISTREFGFALHARMSSLPPAAWDLYNSVKATGGRVLGTPQSFGALRSKVMAVQPLFGHYTCSLNLCPSEMGSEWTFAMAGKEYPRDFSLEGIARQPRE